MSPNYKYSLHINEKKRLFYSQPIIYLDLSRSSLVYTDLFKYVLSYCHCHAIFSSAYHIRHRFFYNIRT